jgi:cell division protein FtsB
VPEKRSWSPWPVHRLAFLVAVAGVLAAGALADPHGVRMLHKLEADIAREEAANQALREENARLARAAKTLGNPPEPRALERAARDQLGYVRPGEVLFKFE